MTKTIFFSFSFLYRLFQFFKKTPHQQHYHAETSTHHCRTSWHESVVEVFPRWLIHLVQLHAPLTFRVQMPLTPVTNGNRNRTATTNWFELRTMRWLLILQVTIFFHAFLSIPWIVLHIIGLRLKVTLGMFEYVWTRLIFLIAFLSFLLPHLPTSVLNTVPDLSIPLCDRIYGSIYPRISPALCRLSGKHASKTCSHYGILVNHCPHHSSRPGVSSLLPWHEEHPPWNCSRLNHPHFSVCRSHLRSLQCQKGYSSSSQRGKDEQWFAPSEKSSSLLLKCSTWRKDRPRGGD